MPDRRTYSEALRETVEELRGERDLGYQDQALPALAQRLGHRFEIDLGLARAGDAFEQEDAGVMRRHGLAQAARGGMLGRAELRHRVIGVGRRKQVFRRHRAGFEGALIDEPVDHPGADGRRRGRDRSCHAKARPRRRR